jgi:integrase
MLKATLNVKENIDIGAFLKVIAFLKRNAVGYEAKKSKVLTIEEVNTFLKEADDNGYLLMKVALLFGICGAWRIEELHSLHVGDIVEQGSSLFITLSDTHETFSSCKMPFIQELDLRFHEVFSHLVPRT